MIDFLKNLDIKIFYFINHNMKNNIFDIIMPIITDVKNFYLIFFLLWLAIMISKHYKNRIAGIGIIFGVTLSDILSSRILKHIFLRPRPFEVLDNVFKLVSSAGPSFPSSHAFNSFTAATLITFFFKKKFFSLIAYFIAFLSSFSRIYVGVHYPSDIFFGAIFGFLFGWLFYKIIKKFFLNSSTN